MRRRWRMPLYDQEAMQVEKHIEHFRSIMNSADTLIKWSFGLNGAAAAGLVTFLGNTVDKQDKFFDWPIFGQSITFFIVGLILSLLCNFSKLLAVNFSSHLLQVEDGLLKLEPAQYLKVSNKWFGSILVTVVIYSASIICFIAGVWYAKRAIFG